MIQLRNFRYSQSGCIFGIGAVNHVLQVQTFTRIQAFGVVMKIINYPLVLIALFTLALNSAWAGWKAVDQDGTVTVLSEGKIKYTDLDGMGTIIDSSRELITLFNSQERVYVSGSAEEFCAGIDEMMKDMAASIPPEQKAMMEEMMANMPPEERAAMERMMGVAGTQLPPPVVSIKQAGNGGKIAGWDTVKYEVNADDRLYEEVWIVNDSAIMKEMGKVNFAFFQSFSACMNGLEGGAQDVENSPEYTELLKHGWQVKSVSHGDVEQYGSDTVSLEQQAVPESEFEVNSGYRKVGMKEFFTLDGEEE
jgi:hypothetical protein